MAEAAAAQDRLEEGEQVRPGQELADHRAHDRRAPHAAAHDDGEAHPARVVTDGVEADVVQQRGRAILGGAGEARRLELGGEAGGGLADLVRRAAPADAEDGEVVGAPDLLQLLLHAGEVDGRRHLRGRAAGVVLEDGEEIEIPEDIRYVGWYELGVPPGVDRGSAVLVAHRDGGPPRRRARRRGSGERA